MMIADYLGHLFNTGIDCHNKLPVNPKVQGGQMRDREYMILGTYR
jgi:hypothetical protein